VVENPGVKCFSSSNTWRCPPRQSWLSVTVSLGTRATMLGDRATFFLQSKQLSLRSVHLQLPNQIPKSLRMPRLTNPDRTHSAHHLPFRQMSIACHQPLSILISCRDNFSRSGTTAFESKQSRSRVSAWYHKKLETPGRKRGALPAVGRTLESTARIDESTTANDSAGFWATRSNSAQSTFREPNLSVVADFVNESEN
jgi:hypothetical protein